MLITVSSAAKGAVTDFVGRSEKSQEKQLVK